MILPSTTHTQAQAPTGTSLCLLLILTVVSFTQGVVAWGAAGHEIVATIAQAHLHPSVISSLCTILPPEAQCHLAPVAAWADTIKGRYPETAVMHYVNPIDDWPAERCIFGKNGWTNERVNVLTAIMNMTSQVRDRPINEKDIPLRFLVHFMGDLHQPLHLTGRARGGNDAVFKFEGHIRSLHSTWDGGLINKNIRELTNYTSPTSNKNLERALLGANFDPYVRFIVQEGIRGWWLEDAEKEWSACPPGGDPYPTSKLGDNRKVRELSVLKKAYKSAMRLVFKTVLPNLAAPMNLLAAKLDVVPASYEGFDHRSLKESKHARSISDTESASEATNDSIDEKDTLFPACPMTWASDIHPINCEYAWPKNWDPRLPRFELDTPSYMDPINNDHVIERVLAMGGIRLAAILNTIFMDKDAEKMFEDQGGLYPTISSRMLLV